MKQVKWTGDMVVTSTECGEITVYEGAGKLEKKYTLKESGPSYEIDTLPTSHLLSSSKDQPVHLFSLDSSPPRLLTQFLCRNHVEEVITPICLRANPHNQTLVTGHAKGILKLFDLNQPHEQPQTLELRKGKRKLKTPISSIDYNPTSPDILAFSAFDSSLHLVDTRHFPKIQHKLMNKTESMGKYGVSQVRFTMDGQYLLAGTRKENSVYMWDIRNLKESFVQFQFLRSSTESNQKFYFDISSETLVGGSPDGTILAYSL